MKKKSNKLTLDQPVIYEVSVPGIVNEDWLLLDDEVEVAVSKNEAGNVISRLKGEFDQAALQGLLKRLYSYGLPLISVVCKEFEGCNDLGKDN
jgi:hypothetical protein